MKLPPVAARQMRDEARGVALEKLSARRAEADRVSVTIAVEVHEEHAGGGSSSHRSNGSNAQGDDGVPYVRAERLGLGFISPEYGEDFEDSGRDAVAQHVSAFMGGSSEGADELSQDDVTAAVEYSQQPIISTVCSSPSSCVTCTVARLSHSVSG